MAGQAPCWIDSQNPRQLYESAEYDRALAVMETIDTRGMAPDLARDRALYQALCLFALDLRVEAAAGSRRRSNSIRCSAQATICRRAYSHLSDEVRDRVRPSLASQRYRAGKGAFDAGRYDAALKEFTIVLELANEDRAHSPEGPSSRTSARLRQVSAICRAGDRSRTGSARDGASAGVDAASGGHPTRTLLRGPTTCRRPRCSA